MHVLGGDAGDTAQHVMRGLIEALIRGILVKAQTDLDGFDGIGFLLLFLQLFEDLGGLVGGRGPDDFQAGEGEGQEDELGLQIGGRVGGGGEGGGVMMVIGERVEGEGFVLVEFDEEHGPLVVLQHRFRLVEQPARFERGDEIAHRLALDADFGGQDVVAHREHAGYDDDGASMQKGGERRAEFPNVHDDPRRFGRGRKTAAAGDTGVDRSQELFLGIVRDFAVESESDGHLLKLDFSQRIHFA